MTDTNVTTGVNADIKDSIEVLVKKAKDTHDAQDALRFSQAALNIAHVRATLVGANTLENSSK